MTARITMAEYISLKAFSGGLASTLLDDSPFHAWYRSPWNPDRPSDPSNASDIGTSAHAVLLEGDESGLSVIDPADYPSKPTKANPEGNIPAGWTNNAIREARDAAYAAGKTPVLTSSMRDIRLMVERARAYVAETELAGILDDSEPELTFTWQENGVDCKIRPDRLSTDRRIILSYKTTPGTSNPRRWIRTTLPMHEVGMALYERGIRRCCDVERTRVVHLIQSQVAPYACSLVALAPSRQDLAERQLDTALGIWRECLRTKRFPGYPTAICYAEASAWQESDFEDRYEEAEIDKAMEALKS